MLSAAQRSRPRRHAQLLPSGRDSRPYTCTNVGKPTQFPTTMQALTCLAVDLPHVGLGVAAEHRQRRRGGRHSAGHRRVELRKVKARRMISAGRWRGGHGSAACPPLAISSYGPFRHTSLLYMGSAAEVAACRMSGGAPWRQRGCGDGEVGQGRLLRRVVKCRALSSGGSGDSSRSSSSRHLLSRLSGRRQDDAVGDVVCGVRAG